MGQPFSKDTIIERMRTLRPRADQSVLVVIDVQPPFLNPIHLRDKLFQRVQFMVEMATLLKVRMLVTEQVPDKMGGTDERLLRMLPNGVHPIAKESFGCCECPDFIVEFKKLGLRQAILVGIETHICVSQTALGLTDLGIQTAVCPDAVSARSIEMHKLGMERMRDVGVAPIHTEAVAYEWLESANHEQFREAVKLVKRYAG